MSDEPWLSGLISVGLILGNAFFVAAEYSLVSTRRNRIEPFARKGNRNAKRVLDGLNNLSVYVAAAQVGITIFSIGVGSITEPFVSDWLKGLFGAMVPTPVSFAVSIFLVTMAMVVIGELVPKYVSLHRPERVCMFLISPMWLFATIFKPLVWLVEWMGSAIVRPFGIKVDESTKDAVPREELLLLVRAGGSEGVLDKVHAEMVSKAMQLDRLAARDIMIHRLDINWIDVSSGRDEILADLGKIAHTRIPICRGDVDEVVGIVYINDVVKNLGNPSIDLAALARPAIAIPESLPLDRIVTLMREEKTQILIVVDEYGGTSGLITLEDVVEEIFGELEDSLEGDRPPIEVHAGGRVSARADVRFDELVANLGVELDEPPSTDSLATLLIEAVERMPKLGDVAETPIGSMRIENMARRRVTRVSVQLTSEIAAKLGSTS